MTVVAATRLYIFCRSRRAAAITIIDTAGESRCRARRALIVTACGEFVATSMSIRPVAVLPAPSLIVNHDVPHQQHPLDNALPTTLRHSGASSSALLGSRIGFVIMLYAS